MNTELMKSRRIEIPLTQVQIAKKIGVTPIAYQRYEAGERVPNVHTSIRIADALKVKTYKDFKDIFGAGTPDMATSPDENRAK